MKKICLLLSLYSHFNDNVNAKMSCELLFYATRKQSVSYLQSHGPGSFKQFNIFPSDVWKENVFFYANQ